MDQNTFPLHIQDGGSVVLPDGRRVFSHGSIRYPDGYIGTVHFKGTFGVNGVVLPADGSHGSSPDPFGPSFTIVVVSGEPFSRAEHPNIGNGLTNNPPCGRYATSFGPSRPSFPEPQNQVALTTEESSSQEEKQKAGLSGRAEGPEKIGESGLQKQTPTTTETPPNFDPDTGFYRAFVRFMDGRKVNLDRLREHLETFGPVGPYLSPSPSHKHKVSGQQTLGPTTGSTLLLPFSVHTSESFSCPGLLVLDQCR